MQSTISILVDLGYAFDYYSILDIKTKLGLQDESKINAIKTNLIEQLTLENFTAIVDSQEYKDLLHANKKTFDAVEKARFGNITAKEVDDCNMLRYNAKINLQRAFAETSEFSIIEVKT
jgi:hypothetical protein